MGAIIGSLQQFAVGSFEATVSNPYIKIATQHLDENKLHIALAACFGIVLCKNDFYFTNIACVSAGVYIQQKRNNDVKYLSDTVVAACYQNRAIFLATLIAAFALSRICGWKAASIGFGYYLARQYLPQVEEEKKLAEKSKEGDAAKSAPSMRVDGDAAASSAI